MSRLRPAMSRRLLPILLAALAILGLAACGDKEQRVTHGESEAFYVTLGEMQYQVQISRQLNPQELGDRQTLVGIPPAERELTADQVWFGVWVRIFNETDGAQRGADEFRIVDTRGVTYQPIQLQPVNSFAYRSVRVPGKSQYPELGSVPAQSPSTGALVLFKLPRQALDFRPLELAFGSSELPGAESSVQLDV